MSALAVLASVFGTAFRPRVERPALAVIAGTDLERVPEQVRKSVPNDGLSKFSKVMLNASTKDGESKEDAGGTAFGWEINREEPCSGSEFLRWYHAQNIQCGIVPGALLRQLYLECCEVNGWKPYGRNGFLKSIKKAGIRGTRPWVKIDGERKRPQQYVVPEVGEA